MVPDIAVIQRDRIPLSNQPYEGAPDWMIEFLSPDQSTTKLIEKIQICLNEGTNLGWLLDATERVVMVLQPERSPFFLRNKDLLPVLETIPLTVDQVLGWLQRQDS